MPTTSVTLMRLRSIHFVPLFYVHAQRVIAQIRKADGHLCGAVKRDHDLAFWTITVWRDDIAINAFAAGGAHRNAMPHLYDWCSEAATVRWAQEDARLPDWEEVVRRLRENGRAPKLRHPGSTHAGLSHPAPTGGYDLRL